MRISEEVILTKMEVSALLLLKVFTRRNWYVDLVILLWINGIPKYFPKEGLSGIVVIKLSPIASPLGTLPDTKSLDFLVLTLCPAASQNSSITSLIIDAWSVEAFPKRRRWSAKKRWGIANHRVFLSSIVSKFFLFIGREKNLDRIRVNHKRREKHHLVFILQAQENFDLSLYVIKHTWTTNAYKNIRRE